MTKTLATLKTANKVATKFPLRNIVTTTCESATENKIGCYYFIEGELTRRWLRSAEHPHHQILRRPRSRKHLLEDHGLVSEGAARGKHRLEGC